ncbi:MAG: SDR family NAD(P)-dependent oxidoreductase, partial [Planctomycetota bacterium]
MGFFDMVHTTRLEGKRALITGAASGIGAASARCFAAEGAAVVIADINKRLGTEVARQIRDTGGEAHFLRADVTDRQRCRRMVKD